MNIIMDSINFVAATPCQSNSYVEVSIAFLLQILSSAISFQVRYGSDMGNTGPRLEEIIALNALHYFHPGFVVALPTDKSLASLTKSWSCIVRIHQMRSSHCDTGLQQVLMPV